MLKTLIAALILQQIIQLGPAPIPGQAAGPTVRVSGTASREDGQAPRGQVRLLGANGTYTSPVAPDGSFQFPGVPAGTYSFSGGPALATTPMEPLMVVVGNTEISNLRLVVPRVSTVGAVRVVTNVDGGGPLPRYQMTFLKVGAPAGTLPFSVTAGAENFALNMNAGDYRLAAAALIPGYSVKSMTSGSTNLLEQPLKVGVGETLQVTVLLGVSSPPPWVKVSGRVTGVRPTEIALIPNGVNTVQIIPPRSDGTFEFNGVLPGSYSLQANTTIGTASTFITVVSGKDLTNVEIKTQPAREIPGRVVINDPAKPRVGFSIVVPNRPINAPGQRFNAPTGPDGKFTLTLPEGENRLVFEPALVPPGFVLKSATYGSLDILANPIKVAATDTAELILTFDSAGVSPVSVSGRINGLKSATNARISLVATATNAAMDTAVNPDGTFTFPRVFPGQYQARFSFNSAQVQTGVTVGTTNKTDVFLNYGREFQLTGQVVMEGLPVGTPPVPVTVEVRRADGVGAPITARSTSVGVLRIMVPEGEMTFAVRDVPAGYQVKSFTYGDLDILKNPLKLDDPALWTFVLKIGRP